MTNPELDAALSYVRSVLSPFASTDDQTSFLAALQGHLYSRTASWDVSDPERGSAARAILWQPHNGGEGLDEAILSACSDTVASGRDAAETQRIAASLLPQPFTLWIDPGCVAVRSGVGAASPYRTLFTTRTHRPAPSIDGVDSLDVLYGQMSLGVSASATLPGLSLSGNNAASYRSFPSKKAQPFFTARDTVPFPMSSSDRSQRTLAPNGNATLPSRSLSITSSIASDSSCPSLTSTAASEESDSDYSSSAPSSRSGSLKMKSSAIPGLTSNDGKDHTCCSTASEADNGSQIERPPAPGQTGKVSRLYDNGNVGVLGGGIKLGGGSKSSASRTRARAMSTKSNPSVQPHLGRPHFINGQRATAPVRTIPLPSVCNRTSAYQGAPQHAPAPKAEDFQSYTSLYADEPRWQPMSTYPVHTCGSLTPVELQYPMSASSLSPSPATASDCWPSPLDGRARASRGVNRQANALKAMLSNGLDPWEPSMQLDVDVHHLNFLFDDDTITSEKSCAETDSEGGSLRSFSSSSRGSSSHSYAPWTPLSTSSPWSPDTPAIGLGSILSTSAWATGCSSVPTSGSSTPALWQSAPPLPKSVERKGMELSSHLINAPSFSMNAHAPAFRTAKVPSHSITHNSLRQHATAAAQIDKNVIGLHLGMPAYRTVFHDSLLSPSPAPSSHVNFA